MKLLCKLNIHLPVSIEGTLFIDKVNNQEVYSGKCPCGISWMHQSIFRFPLFFKVRQAHEKP